MKRFSMITGIVAVLFSAFLLTTCSKDDDSNNSTTATCSDGIKNQNETGVDCGGVCAACAAACGTPSGLSAPTATISNNQAVLSWSAVSGATSYNLQYRLIPNAFGTPVSVSGTSKTISGLSSSSYYEWRVQAVCTSTGSYSSTSSFVTTASGSNCGMATGLSVSAVDSTNATLTWANVSGATSYNIQYNTTGTSPWTPASSTTNSKTISGLTKGTKYYWQIQSICSSGSSAYTISNNFTTTSAPSGTISAIVDGTTWVAANYYLYYSNPTFMFKWGRGISPTDSIYVGFSGMAQTTSPIVLNTSLIYFAGVSSGLVANAGQISFTKVDATNRLMSGTFYFNAGGHSVTSGAFTDISY